MARATRENSTTRRTFIRAVTGGAALAAVPALPVFAQGTVSDARCLAVVAKARAVVEQYVAAEAHFRAIADRCEAEPDWPGFGAQDFIDVMRAAGSTMSDRTLERMHDARCRRVNARLGREPAYDAWNEAGAAMRPPLECAMASQPETLAGFLAKLRLAELVHRETDEWETEEVKDVLPKLVADLERLIGGQPLARKRTAT